MMGTSERVVTLTVSHIARYRAGDVLKLVRAGDDLKIIHWW